MVIQNDRCWVELNVVYVCVCGGAVGKIPGGFMECTLQLSFEGGGEGQGAWMLV